MINAQHKARALPSPTNVVISLVALAVDPLQGGIQIADGPQYAAFSCEPNRHVKTRIFNQYHNENLRSSETSLFVNIAEHLQKFCGPQRAALQLQQILDVYMR